MSDVDIDKKAAMGLIKKNRSNRQRFEYDRNGIQAYDPCFGLPHTLPGQSRFSLMCMIKTGLLSSKKLLTEKHECSFSHSGQVLMNMPIKTYVD
jgi:hypothetical protein